MKSFKTLIVALVLGAAFVMPAVHAQEKGGRRGGDMMKMMTEELSLTEAQVTEIKPIMDEQMKAMGALREDTALSQEARRSKMQEIRTTYRAKIRAKLTPEQQTKYDEMGNRMGGPGGGKGKGKGKEKGNAN